MRDQGPANENDPDGPGRPRTEALFAILAGQDQDERACETIPEAACRHLPRNYLLNIANGACTKLAEQLASPGLVLPWLLSAAGAPAVFAGLLVPAKQVGSLAPQMAVAGWIRGVARRKWVWAGAGLVQAVVLALLGLAALATAGPLFGGLAVGLFLVFSVASGVGSVAFQDVTGKTVDKGLRGRMLAHRATVGGVLTLGVALLYAQRDRLAGELAVTLPLVFVAAGLWALGALVFAAIREAPGATGGGRSIARELTAGWALTRANGPFRRFLLVRGLLLAVELAMPFYVLYATRHMGTAVDTLAISIIFVGLSQVLANPVLGPLADRSARSVLAVSGLAGAGVGAVVLGFAATGATPGSPWFFGPLFLALGVAEAGVRIGRKTYLLDGAPADDRPLYAALSNTVAGVAALSGGLLGLAADLAGPLAAVGLVTGVAVLGLLACLGLPAPERMLEAGASDRLSGGA